jgi:hypothetical protein
MRVPLAEPRIEHQWLISGKQPKTVFYHLHADKVYTAYFPLAEYLIDLHDLDGLWKCESKGISDFAILPCAAAIVEQPRKKSLPGSMSQTDLAISYNIAPSQKVLTIRFNPQTQRRSLDALQWGLIPYWAKEPKIAYRTINA